MPDFFNNEIVNGLFTDPTDILFVPNGVTALTLTSSAATFGVPLVGNGSGLTGITASSTPFTGGTVTGTTTFTGSLSATTYLGLPTDIRVTGGTYSNGTATFTNNTGGTFNVTGFSTPFTGGTVTGSTTFSAGLSASTISATTFYGSATGMTEQPITGLYSAFASLAYYDYGLTAIAYGTRALAANEIIFSPMIWPEQVTFDRIGINITATGATGTMIKFCIFDSDANGIPNNLIYSSTTASTTTTGFKEITQTLTFNKNVKYWCGVQSNGICTTAAIALTSCYNLGSMTNPSNAPTCSIRVILANFNSPANFAAVGTWVASKSSLIPPVVKFRKS